jgi:hypothetical protein
MRRMSVHPIPEDEVRARRSKKTTYLCNTTKPLLKKHIHSSGHLQHLKVELLYAEVNQTRMKETGGSQPRKEDLTAFGRRNLASYGAVSPPISFASPYRGRGGGGGV